MANRVPPPGPLADAYKRLKAAQRDQAKAQRELEYQRRLEQIAEEAAKGEIAKLKAQKVERAQPQERPAPVPSPVPSILPAITGVIGGRSVSLYQPSEREPAWSRHHDSALFGRRPSRPSYTGYGTKRRA
jgi:hypothetical protein